MILIINNGSQYTHVIWRACRDLGFEAKIVQPEVAESELLSAEKVILSGGPNSVYNTDIKGNRFIIEQVASGKAKIPILGICFGQQAIAHVLGGKVEKGASAEYGTMDILIDKPEGVLSGLPPKIKAWVSHYDEVKKMPEGFISLAHSAVCECEAMRHGSLPIHSVQFHPEVWHTEHGEKILENFLKL
ncbi:MAG: GMP synthase subunit A [Candidatus Micrarchaeia archaeon]